MNTSKPYGANAVNDLSKFMKVAKNNPKALNALEDEINEGHAVIDAAADSPILFLNKRLASFL
ncbi:hypothetical protein [Propionivibrio sp.]|uniref:hypothetical protein n=1 Tax=Propionivibrio sp. TaxID=2212460 RepID=UPI00272DD31D|nr:hypothetical protein [Propionivibrio sp.]